MLLILGFLDSRVRGKDSLGQDTIFNSEQLLFNMEGQDKQDILLSQQ